MFLLCDNLSKVETTQQVNTTSLWQDEERQDSYLRSNTFQSTWLLQVRYKTAENEDDLWSGQVLPLHFYQIQMQLSSGLSAAKENVSANGVKGRGFLVA